MLYKGNKDALEDIKIGHGLELQLPNITSTSAASSMLLPRIEDAVMTRYEDRYSDVIDRDYSRPRPSNSAFHVHNTWIGPAGPVPMNSTPNTLDCQCKDDNHLQDAVTDASCTYTEQFSADQS